MNYSPDRILCPMCGCSVQITKDGLFRRHSDPISKHLDMGSARLRTWAYTLCINSGQPYPPPEDCAIQPRCKRKARRGGCGCPELGTFTPTCADGNW